MSEILSTETESLLITLSNVINKELKFISDNRNNWVDIADDKKKYSMHDLHFLLTKRNIEYADKLFAIAIKNGDENNPKVKSTLKELSKFFNIYEKNYSRYINMYDLSKILESMDDNSVNIKTELGFQSDITKNLAGLRDVMLKISRFDDKSSITIPIFNNRPVPFLMSETFEDKYPQLKELMNEKRKNFKSKK